MFILKRALCSCSMILMDGCFGDVLDWKRTTQLNNQSHPCLLGVIFLNQRGCTSWGMLILKAGYVFDLQFEMFTCYQKEIGL